MPLIIFMFRYIQHVQKPPNTKIAFVTIIWLVLFVCFTLFEDFRAISSHFTNNFLNSLTIFKLDLLVYLLIFCKIISFNFKLSLHKDKNGYGLKEQTANDRLIRLFK